MLHHEPSSLPPLLISSSALLPASSYQLGATWLEVASLLLLSIKLVIAALLLLLAF
jgi:hypothetical protein